MPDDNVSLWVATSEQTSYPPLSENIKVDVAVIGGGITGLTTAALLKAGGAKVAVIEAGRIVTGVTGYTTAKVTSLHGTIYQQLESSLGEEAARIYGEANQAAIERVAQFVEELSIDCDFQRMDSFTYAENSNDLGKVEKEVSVAQSVGLPASFAKETALPFDVEGAVRFENQALFHPRKYCLALAAFIAGDGSHVFETTRANDVEDSNPCVVKTDRGEIQADGVVIATLLPFLDKGLFFAKTHPERSYALAVRVEGETPTGMYLSAGQQTRSIRPHPVGDEMLLLLGGEGHKTGQEPETAKRYEQLESWARENFPVASVEYRWSAQDYLPVDGIPYIGFLDDETKRIFVGTGFKKWGMTNGTVAAMILSDTILGRDNPWSATFDSNRSNPKASAKDFVKENANVAKRFGGDRLKTMDAPSIEELGMGEGGIVKIDGEKAAAYKDDSGAVHAVSPVCTHMGCLVAWNGAEKSWDCPCHGSRFDTSGKVLAGPAVKDLEPVESKEQG